MSQCWSLINLSLKVVEQEWGSLAVQGPKGRYSFSLLFVWFLVFIQSRVLDCVSKTLDESGKDDDNFRQVKVCPSWWTLWRPLWCVCVAVTSTPKAVRAVNSSNRHSRRRLYRYGNIDDALLPLAVKQQQQSLKCVTKYKALAFAFVPTFSSVWWEEEDEHNGVNTQCTAVKQQKTFFPLNSKQNTYKKKMNLFSPTSWDGKKILKTFLRAHYLGHELSSKSQSRGVKIVKKKNRI
jgi:hypothetical protein